MQQLNEGDELGMPGLETHFREGSMVATPVAFVARQQERMMDAVPTPEPRAVLVVGEKIGEDRAVFDIDRIVCVEPHEEKSRILRGNPLVGLASEQLRQVLAGMSLEHRV
jgi:hypothetical protein